MVKKIAAEYFRGKQGYNCAQAILKTFEKTHNISQETIALHKKSGGGRVPGGLCSALFIAKKLVDDNKFTKIQTEFTRLAGSEKCKDIRREGLLLCKDCVSLVAELVSRSRK